MFLYHPGLYCLGSPVFLFDWLLRPTALKACSQDQAQATAASNQAIRARAGSAGQPARGGWAAWGLGLALAIAPVVSGVAPAQAKPPAAAPEALAVVALSTLPAEAQHTYQRIHAGGPFPYAKDGTVFGNRERLLPRRPRGEYREYTVKTPGLSHRGARRIVCGGLPPDKPESCFYTADHYNSFRRIEP